LFAFAGLYRYVDDETGTYGFLTWEANPLVGAVAGWITHRNTIRQNTNTWFLYASPKLRLEKR